VGGMDFVLCVINPFMINRELNKDLEVQIEKNVHEICAALELNKSFRCIEISLYRCTFQSGRDQILNFLFVEEIQILNC
jgi:hypothetical protein